MKKYKIKYLFLIVLFIGFSLNIYAQKQKFDVVTFTAPKGWDKTVTENGVQLSTKNDGQGNYAAAVIVRSIASEGSPEENFRSSWEKLVKGTVNVTEVPQTTDMDIEKGWTCITGQSNYTDGSTKGLVTLVTATGNGKMANLVIMTNTSKYQTELLSFINSVELAPVPVNSASTTPAVNNANNSAVVGLWTDYILETTGYSINGMPQYTAGYLRKEYTFYPDGTYLFRNKQWLTKTANILFIYETGTYAVNGNQLTITPKSGKNGFWGKTSSSKEWGKFIKYSDYSLEKTSYTFEISHDPNYGDKIILKPGKPTARDGGKFNAPGDPYEFYYSKRELASSIDNPPGFKTDFYNKITKATKKDAAVTINSPLTGKIWEGTTTEKFSNAGGTSYNTGGFATNQYQFNADGTYSFVSVTASHFTNTKSLQYETGTYTISGNQLTITPTKGYNEEWSKIGKTSNGNSDVANRAINETWGKKLKTSSRKLETVTYTFSIGKNGERTALMLQYGNGHTEREGDGNQTYLNETPPENSVPLPEGMNL